MGFNAEPRFVSIAGNYAYVDSFDDVNDHEKIRIFDVSDPTTLTEVGSLSFSGTVLRISGNYAYLLTPLELKVLDISSPAAPQLRNTVKLFDEENHYTIAKDIAIDGNYAYITGTLSYWIDTVFVYDISNPASPSPARTYERHGDYKNIIVEGNYIYLLDDYGRFEVLERLDMVSFEFRGCYSFNEHTTTQAASNGCIYFNELSVNRLHILRFQPDETPPKIALNRDTLYFRAVKTGEASPSQSVRVENRGGGSLAWTVETDSQWIHFSKIGSGEVGLSVYHDNLEAGSYTGTVGVRNMLSGFDTETITVYLRVYEPSETTVPFGEMATPSDNAVVGGSVPFTGWALDDIGVQDVKLYLVSGNSSTPIGDAVFVEGARPDIESAYPTYPLANKAGWGYMMLTNFLPGGGNGTYTFRAAAVDMEGNDLILGTKTIYMDNANAVKPFGAVDTPGQGGSASGGVFANHGWVLTPPPNTIPTDGSTIHVWVDGQSPGNPVYNQYRSDIEGLFPGYTNSGGAGGVFYLDTTKYTNGVHTIYWTAADNAGNTEGIGSRYFSIQNSQNRSAAGTAASTSMHGGNEKRFTADGPVGVDRVTPVWVKKGFVVNGEFEHRYPSGNGVIPVEIRELERLEIALLPPGELLTGSGEMVVEPLSPAHRCVAGYGTGYFLLDTGCGVPG